MYLKPNQTDAKGLHPATDIILRIPLILAVPCRFYFLGFQLPVYWATSSDPKSTQNNQHWTQAWSHTLSLLLSSLTRLLRFTRRVLLWDSLSVGLAAQLLSLLNEILHQIQSCLLRLVAEQSFWLPLLSRNIHDLDSLSIKLWVNHQFPAQHVHQSKFQFEEHYDVWPVPGPFMLKCSACKPLDVAIRIASFSSLACTGSGSPALDTKCRIPFSVAMSHASARALMASLSLRSSSISCAGLIGGSGASLFLFLGKFPDAKKVTGSAW